jgi:hypothetical protein
MHVVSFFLLSSVTFLIAYRLRWWLGNSLYLILVVLSLSQFAYLAVAIRRFYLSTGRWATRFLSVVAAFLIYALNTAFMTAVQVVGAAIALALA